MKIAVVLLCSTLALAAAATVGSKKADKAFLGKQDKLVIIYVRPNQPNLSPDQSQIAKTFSFDQVINQFTNPSTVRNFQAAFQQGALLPRGEVFNYNNAEHLRQAIQLFDILYFAKDYDTFYKTSCWARDNVNEGVWVYAHSVAVLNRPDTQGVAIFRPSEINPSLYVESRIIDLAQIIKQRGQKQVIVKSNHTNHEQQNYQFHLQSPESYPYKVQNQGFQANKDCNQDDYLSYYVEDVNLNQQFAYERLKNPSWLSGPKYQKNGQNQNNGENYAYYLQQTLARYNLERYSNVRHNVEPFQFNENIESGYYAQLVYISGQPVPGRPNNYNVKNADKYLLQELQNIDRRVADAVDSSQAVTADGSKVKLDDKNGISVLGSIVQNSGDSPHSQYYAAENGYYGLLDQCRRVVGSLITGQNLNAPTVIDNDNTAQRDPAFYQCLARVVNYFYSFKNKLKPYNQEQLNFPGVKVQSVTCEKLVTYFDNVQFDLFNAIDYKDTELVQSFVYKAEKVQIKPKPFTYQIQVNSDKSADAIVRIFIGPKYDSQGSPLSLDVARKNFVEIDRFTTKLISGQNNIQRSSQESTRYVSQQIDSSVLVDNIWQALKGGPAFYYDENLSQRQATFPANLILPKGVRGGQEYVLAVAISPYQGKQQNQQSQAEQPTDDKPQGFPFDRSVLDGNFQQAQNIYFQTVKIFNKNRNEINNPQ